MVGHVPGFPLFKPLQDNELRTVSVPVTLLVAARSEPFDPNQLAGRAQTLLPQVSVDLIPDAGHALTESHIELCAARIAQADT
jgi:pimeloyl-ACP methyl ester carboxylesterase